MSSNIVEDTTKGHLQVTSSSAHGMVITMNAWVAPSNAAAYITEAQLVQRKFLETPENLFCALSVNPKDEGHLRIVHAWKADSAWFGKTFYTQPWFEDFIKKTKPMWIKDREFFSGTA